MPIFTLKLTYRGESNQKAYWESVVSKLQSRGAHIVNIQSKAGKAGDPLTPVNVVTITYEAPIEIKHIGEG